MHVSNIHVQRHGHNLHDNLLDILKIRLILDQFSFFRTIVAIFLLVNRVGNKIIVLFSDVFIPAEVINDRVDPSGLTQKTSLPASLDVVSSINSQTCSTEYF